MVWIMKNKWQEQAKVIVSTTNRKNRHLHIASLTKRSFRSSMTKKSRAVHCNQWSSNTDCLHGLIPYRTQFNVIALTATIKKSIKSNVVELSLKWSVVTVREEKKTFFSHSMHLLSPIRRIFIQVNHFTNNWMCKLIQCNNDPIHGDRNKTYVQKY